MAHYKDKFLYEHKGVGCASNTFKKTNYGYAVKKMTNFISIIKTKLYIFDDGTAKATTKVNTNYTPPYQYTTYFDDEGIEIVTEGNNVRKELAVWKKLKQTLSKV